MPTIKVVQYMFGGLEYFRWSEAINRHYCDRHGYPYVVSRQEPRPDRHVNWHKIPVLQQELHDCDFLLYLDADAHFYSLELTIEEELLPLLGDRSIAVAQDCVRETSRWNVGHPNAGVLFMANVPEVHDILAAWNETSADYEYERWHLFHEQTTLGENIMKRFPAAFRLVEDYYLMNSQEGLYIRHDMGMSNELRSDLIRDFFLRRVDVPSAPGQNTERNR